MSPHARSNIGAIPVGELIRTVLNGNARRQGGESLMASSTSLPDIMVHKTTSMKN